MTGIYLAAAHKSSGKTTLAIGLSAAFRALNKSIQTFKKGPDYIDPLWLAKASGTACYNLDFYVDSKQEILSNFYSHSVSKDISLIEGNKGLYDGLTLDGTDSNAALANLLNLPVLLVIDCTGITRGIAPLLLGYQQFQKPEVSFAGVILNKVGGSRHETKLINACKEYTGFKVFGALGKSKDLIIEERHLGLVPSNENQKAQKIIDNLAAKISESIDLKSILNSAAKIKEPAELNATAPAKSEYQGLSIGIVRDAAFGFYYQSDIDRLKSRGVIIKYFSIIQDENIPEVDGIFLGGGFPETHMAAISANTKILKELSARINDGRPVYAECGGMMILARSLTWKEKKLPMANVIQADCIMHEKPFGRGYVTVKVNSGHPWKIQPDKEIKAHEFHYSRLCNFSENYNYAYTVERGTGIKDKQDGLIYKNLLASYAHFKDGANFHWIDEFLEFCLQLKKS